MNKGGYTYIMSNKNRTVLYVGITNDLQSRIYQHRYSNGSAFTSKYNCHDLIFYESFNTIEEAITREKQLKNWRRSWKDELVKKENPELKDLYDEVISW